MKCIPGDYLMKLVERMQRVGSRVAQRSKALHLNAKNVTTDTVVRIQAVSQRAVILAQRRPGLSGVARQCKYEFVLN